MKYILILLICTLPHSVQAQNNQIKLYLQQIAANKVYIEYLQKGYSISKQGLTFIGNVKNTHFTLDKNFFLSLENINPKIKDYSRVAETITYSLEIANDFTASSRLINNSDLFATSEKTYVDRLKNDQLDASRQSIDDLINIINPGKLEMSDDERIKRIDILHGEMRERYLFSKEFYSTLKIQALQRQQEKRDVNNLRDFSK
ncbi:hypothetical protein ACDQ55_15240 [Chitinophaga sp. 30R24]|uniref:hypothetical protein n=1 Tax=Chitinophaga sp. 30R24 TaxID=3248838 RepID=UPI003B915C1E